MKAVPAVPALAWLLVASVSAAQPAEPRHVTLDYRAGPTCPDVSVFRNFVATSLAGRDPFVGAGEAPDRVLVVVRQKGPAYFVAEFALYDANGKKTRPSQEIANECLSLVELVAVLVASWVMPDVVAKPAVPPAPVAPAEKEAPAPVCAQPLSEPARACPAVPPATRLDLWPREWPLPPLRKPDPDPPKPRGPLPFQVGAGVKADYISDSGGSLGLTLGAGVRLGIFSVESEGQWDLALATTPYSTNYIVGILRFSRATGALMLCVHHDALFGCLKGQAGSVLFPGSSPALSALPYGAVGVQVGLEIPVVPWLLVRLDGEFLPTIDPASEMIAHQTVFQVAKVNAGLGLGVRFAWGKR